MATIDQTNARKRMVERHLGARGINDPRVLEAFRTVAREAFVPTNLAEFAYKDAPLPIGEEQTISQPYIVALTVSALTLKGGERVLEIGTGSGYAAAILSRIAKEVFTVERVETLATSAAERLTRLGYGNVHVLFGDGTLGWQDYAPFDAIAVAAGGPRVPDALIRQLKIGGRLVIPVGTDDGTQTLVRVTRTTERDHVEESLCDVRFVPLIGEQGWKGDEAKEPPKAARVLSAPSPTGPTDRVVKLVREVAEPIVDIESHGFDALIDRIADSRLVLIGEATHGTSEFYRMRARITKELILRRGFSFVAVEADWPDAARVDDYVVGGPPKSSARFTPFSRFPTWMWANREVEEFVDWLRAHNADIANIDRRVGFHGLDLYSMFTSIAAVLAYLDNVDPEASKVARARYGLLTPWQKSPAAYGRAVLVGRYRSCEDSVVAMLGDMLSRRFDYAQRDGNRFFDAAQNARVVANAERYYRSMYYGEVDSWNLRDSHMFETLKTLFGFHGPNSKGIVWEHNSHVGDASATEMGARGEHNVGQLCRAEYGRDVYIIGFGTDHGHVAAASNWDEPMERMVVRPSNRMSYERIFHETEVPAFSIHLRDPRRKALRDELMPPRLQRAIGVVYRPDTELQSHYYYATLPKQFDEYIWFDETDAVVPLDRTNTGVDLPETYPFGL